MKPSIELLLQSPKKPPLVLAGWMGTVQQCLPRVVREDLRFAFRSLNLKVHDQTRLAARPGSVTVPIEEDFHANDVLPRFEKRFQIEGVCIQVAGITRGGPPCTRLPLTDNSYRLSAAIHPLAAIGVDDKSNALRNSTNVLGNVRWAGNQIHLAGARSIQ